MKTTHFSFSSSIKTPAQMRPCTPELLNAAMDSQQVADACQEIARHLDEMKQGTLTREEFEKQKTKLKAENLPVVCFHASFSDGYRHNESAVPSGLSIYDLDHLSVDPRAYYMNKVAGREQELGICLVHVSPSGEGIRLVFVMPKGMTLAEAQQWMAQQLGDAGGRFLYTRMDEIGMLNQLKTNGKGNNVTEILRLAYDCGEYGQERIGTKSVSECVEVRWNWNASTTPGKCRRFFGDAMLDGTLSRISFCTIHTDDDLMPVYGNYDDKFRREVQKLVAQLCEPKGLVLCKRATQLTAEMIEETRHYTTLADDDTYRELSYRANLSAFKRGMVLYILNGMKWSREIEDFVRWSFRYDMWCKMWIFGEKMRKAMDLDKAPATPGRRNLMELLHNPFTLEDLNIVRRAQDMTGNYKDLLRKWIYRGYCTYDPVNQVYIKSQEYLDRHEKQTA